MKARALPWLALFAGCMAAPVALAAASDDPRSTNDFMTYHPDMAYRNTGIDAYRRGNYEVAADYFRRASRFADKASEAMLAELYWKGEGVAKDHALAYAWSDLAAERGYPSLLAMREDYWRQLSQAEQARAIEAGQALYAEYGDSVAKPRLAIQLRRGLHEAAGSHLGYLGSLRVIPNKPVCNTGGGCGGGDYILASGIPGEEYYAPRYWDEQQYYAWQDTVWNVAPRHGQIDVGKPETLHNVPATEPGQPQSDHYSQID